MSEALPSPLERRRMVIRLRPVEGIMIAFLLMAIIIAELFGRPYYFLLGQNIRDVMAQFNWLLPCFAMHYLFAIHGVRRSRARVIYLLYYLALTFICIGSSISNILTESVDGGLSGRTAYLLTQMFRFNGFLIMLAALLTIPVWRRDPVRTKAVVKKEVAGLTMVLRLLASVMICFSVYSNLKAMVPVIHPGLMDGTFYAMDKILFLGTDPYAWIQAHSSPKMDTLMSRSYFFFFFFIVYGLSGAYIFGTPLWYERAVTAFVIAYVIGVAGYCLFPAVGPAFYEETAHFLRATSGDGLKRFLLGHYRDFCLNPQTAKIARCNGLAAFPSLHCAHSLLFMYYLGKKEIWMPVILFIPLVLLLISTVWLGWHWAVDLLGGVLVAWLTIRLTRRLYPESPEAKMES